MKRPNPKLFPLLVGCVQWRTLLAWARRGGTHRLTLEGP
jgi:hypothetical protein